MPASTHLPSMSLLILLLALPCMSAGEEGPATGGIRGGLCVVLGAADAELPLRLVEQGPFIVQVLDEDAARVQALSVQLQKRRLYGRVAVEQWNGPGLPFADRLVSLLVVPGATTIPLAEQQRVVRPLGEIAVRQDGSWKRTVMPWVDGMDEWTHWRHGADGNMVSKDRFIEVPKRVQWSFGRDIVSERTFAIYAGGRFFAYEDEEVLARDAFNGLPLWRKRARLKVTDEEKAAGYTNLDRLVADRERVYFTDQDGVFTAHDAADEKRKVAYREAGTPLLVRLVPDGPTGATLVLADRESVRALDAVSGRLLWKERASLPQHLVADREGVYYISGDFVQQEAVEIVARELKSGKMRWRRSDFTDPCPWPALAVGCSMGYGMLAFELQVPRRWPGGHKEYYKQHPKARKGGIIVLSAKDGSTVNETSSGGAAARHGEWNVAYWVNQSMLRNSDLKGTGQRSGIVMNPISDLTKSITFDDNDVGDRGFGHCYPPTITERFYIYGQLNFTDLKTQQHSSNQITRGGCGMRVGYLPANGMIYVHPKHCICFPMLDGNSALAMAYPSSPAPSHPLIRGPAFGIAGPTADPMRDWPMYRHDASRTGGIEAETPAQVKVLWTREIATPDYAKDEVAAEWLQHQYLPGVITPPTIAGGKVFIAQPDSHQVVALDAASGAPAWTFTANGRIDGPPTYHEGLCLFGSRSGWLFAVSASDGRLAWKLRLAPDDRRISQFGQVESPTPVAGSPVIIDGRLYASAGLHPQADHGVLVFCVDPKTGAVIWKQGYTSLGYEERDGWHTPRSDGSAPPLSMSDNPWRTTAIREYEAFDLPVRDGRSVAVSRWQFDLLTGTPTLRKLSAFYAVPETGVWMRRRTWSYGPRREDHRTPLAVCRGPSVFTTLQPKGAGVRLMRVDFPAGRTFADAEGAVGEADKDVDMAKLPSTSPINRYLALGATWKVEADKKVVAHGLACAGGHLFLLAQSGMLEVWSARDGRKLGEQRLEAPVFDGLAAAQGRIYVSTASGKVICLGQ
jgi:outer membrane protein assembly factor BamB